MSDVRQELPTGVIVNPHEIVPRIGASGLFRIKPPFTLVLSEEVEYTVTEIVTIAAYTANGKDPWNEVYKPVGALASVFEDDRLNNRTIIVLQSGFGERFIVPTSAVQMLPIADGVRYVATNFLVSLSALPEDMDLSGLAQDFVELVQARLGVASHAVSILASTPSLISHDEHAAIVAAREAILQQRLTLREQLVHLQEQHQRLMTQHDLLQTHVREKLMDDQTTP